MKKIFILVLISMVFFTHCNSTPKTQLTSVDISGKWEIINITLDEEEPYIVEFNRDGTVIESDEQRLCKALSIPHGLSANPWKYQKFLRGEFSCSMIWYRTEGANTILLNSLNKKSEIYVVHKIVTYGETMNFIYIFPGDFFNGYRSKEGLTEYRVKKLE